MGVFLFLCAEFVSILECKRTCNDKGILHLPESCPSIFLLKLVLPPLLTMAIGLAALVLFRGVKKKARKCLCTQPVKSRDNQAERINTSLVARK